MVTETVRFCAKHHLPVTSYTITAVAILLVQPVQRLSQRGYNRGRQNKGIEIERRARLSENELIRPQLCKWPLRHSYEGRKEGRKLSLALPCPLPPS